MWVGEQQVAHTVAAPGWSAVIVLAGGALDGGVGAVGLDVGEVPGELEAQREVVYVAVLAGPLGPGGVVGQVPPVPVVVPAGALTSARALRAFLAGVDVWWRLDVIDALEQLVQA